MTNPDSESYLDDEALDALARIVATSDDATERDAAFAEIFASVERFVFGEVDDAMRRATNRGGRHSAVDPDDLKATAMAAVAAAIVAWDPEKGPVFHRIAWAVRDELSQDPRDGHLNRSWVKIGRIAWAVRSDMELELGRTPSMAELRRVMATKCLDWELVRLSEKDQDRSREERVTIAEAKMTKSGVAGALANLDEVMLATGSTEYLDAPALEGSSTVGARIVEPGSAVEDHLFAAEVNAAAAVECAFGGMAPATRSAVEQALFALESGDAASLKAAALDVGLERSELAAAMKEAKARSVAPHAQFAYLHGSIDDAFEEASEPSSAAELVAARVAR